MHFFARLRVSPCSGRLVKKTCVAMQKPRPLATFNHVISHLYTIITFFGTLKCMLRP